MGCKQINVKRLNKIRMSYGGIHFSGLNLGDVHVTWLYVSIKPIFWKKNNVRNWNRFFVSVYDGFVIWLTIYIYNHMAVITIPPPQYNFSHDNELFYTYLIKYCTSYSQPGTHSGIFLLEEPYLRLPPFKTRDREFSTLTTPTPTIKHPSHTHTQ